MKWARCVWCVLFGAVFFAWGDAIAASFLIRGSADTMSGFVQYGRSNGSVGTNSAAPPTVQVDNKFILQGVFEFSLAPLAAQGVSASDILSATLELTVYTVSLSSSNLLQLYDLADAQEDGSLTSGDYNATATRLDQSDVGASGQNLQAGDVYARDVTAAVKADINANPGGYGADWTGFLLRWWNQSATLFDKISFYRRTDSPVTVQPTLHVETIAVPEPGAGGLALVGGVLAGGLVVAGKCERRSRRRRHARQPK
ncbi:MAG: hypothetical protein D6776_05960 [Planctomycetota bacterium]|nr:MAG: hypothetical protein D6776_05960 [Planctomycetota bacterium]